MTQPAQTPLISEYADDPDMSELIDLFVEELPDRVARLNDAFAERDLGLLASFAHQLKGAGGGYGFPDITTAGREVEFAVKDHGDDLDLIRQRLDGLIQLCQRASQA